MHSQTYANTYFQTDLEVTLALGSNKTLFKGNKGIDSGNSSNLLSKQYNIINI